MASKFKIKPVSDFKLPVKFNMPNGEEALINFTVMHKRAKEVSALFDAPESERPSDVEFIKLFATGWDLEEEFNDENIADAVEFFPGMVVSFSYEYIRSLAGNRAKN